MSQWFKGSSFSIAFNATVSVGFFTMALNGYIEPLIYNENNLDMLGWCFFVGVVVCLISFTSGFIIGRMHQRSEEM
jgi:hypothetical protein